jgi:hypothetical protein
MADRKRQRRAGRYTMFPELSGWTAMNIFSPWSPVPQPYGTRRYAPTAGQRGTRAGDGP